MSGTSPSDNEVHGIVLLDDPPTDLAGRDIELLSDGIAWRGQKLEFRATPAGGFTRKHVAELLRVNPFSVKRWEDRYPILGDGRAAKNRRVLFYNAASIVALVDQLAAIMDVYAAVRLGFPLSIVPVNRLGIQCNQAAKGIAKLPESFARALIRRYSAWCLSQGMESELEQAAGIVRRPKVVQCTLPDSSLLGFAALAHSTLSKAMASRFSGAVGTTSKDVQLQMARASLALQQAVRTPEGQGLLYLLDRLHQNGDLPPR